MWRLIGFTDILIVILLLLIGALLMHWQNLKSAEAIATLVGALFGGAALLLGNWINRWNERSKACKDFGREGFQAQSNDCRRACQRCLWTH